MDILPLAIIGKVSCKGGLDAFAFTVIPQGAKMALGMLN
jgi:hypothetical protein